MQFFKETTDKAVFYAKIVATTLVIMFWLQGYTALSTLITFRTYVLGWLLLCIITTITMKLQRVYAHFNLNYGWVEMKLEVETCEPEPWVELPKKEVFEEKVKEEMEEFVIVEEQEEKWEELPGKEVFEGKIKEEMEEFVVVEGNEDEFVLI